MKKRYLIIGLLSAHLMAAAQKADTSYAKKRVAKTDIEMLYSYYNQDGTHSAVTAGEGTEKLQVYSSYISINHAFDSLNSYSIAGGLDVITSASTDNIDFAKSSASETDYRPNMTIGFYRNLKGSGYSIGANVGISLESDYASLGPGISLSHYDDAKGREINVSLQSYFDDLRWGRFDEEFRGPEKLIYPSELRFKEWHEEYLRQSFNLSVGFRQIINRRTVFGIYPGLTYQQGLLATPFHRVRFSDNSRAVENLPDQRVKIPLGFELNHFYGSKLIFRLNHRLYWDSFGIYSGTLNLETPYKINPVLTLSPSGRIYAQQGTKYFQPFMQHDPEATFFTSDYDLSSFWSYQLGLGIRYAPGSPILQHSFFDEIGLRYLYYKRSDGLYLHSLSLLVKFRKERNK